MPDIPQSSALAEASPTSLNDLINSDPERYSRADRDTMVAALRTQRKQWKLDEAAGKHKKAKKSNVLQLSSSTPLTAEDLDL